MAPASQQNAINRPPPTAGYAVDQITSAEPGDRNLRAD